MRRTWLGFGDLPVGATFRWRYGRFAGGDRKGPEVLTKVSPRKYRNSDTGKVWHAGADSWVEVVTIEGGTK